MSDFGNYKIVKTRKEHSCIYCGRKIPIGIEAWNSTGLWECDWQNWYACKFCNREVVPDYAEQGEPISGDEFNEWFRDTDYMKCKECGNSKTRYRNNWDWISPTKIKVECEDCDSSWEVEIGFE